MRQIPCAGPRPCDVSAPHRALRQKVRGSPRRSTTRPSLGGQNRRLDASSALASIIRQTHAPTFLAAGPSRPVRTHATCFNPPVPKSAAATIKRGVTPLTAGSATRAAPVQGVTQRPDALEGQRSSESIHSLAAVAANEPTDPRGRDAIEYSHMHCAGCAEL